MQELYDSESTLIKKYYAQGELIPIPKTLDLLKKLHRNGTWLCGLVTSSDRDNMNQVIFRLKLSQYFQVAISNDDVDRCKPYPDIYLLAAKRIGVRPSECVVIEDSKPGIASAKAAGMKVIQYCSDNNEDISEADLKVKDIGLITLENILSLIM